MARTLNLIVVAASAAALTGCARTTLLINHDESSKTSSTSTTGTSATGTSTTTTTAPSPAALAYLAALSREQAKLAAAERRIPRRPRTPAGLAHSIQLLRAAIVRLGQDLHLPASRGGVAACTARVDHGDVHRPARRRGGHGREARWPAASGQHADQRHDRGELGVQLDGQSDQLGSALNTRRTVPL
jgi:hypothetical protein